MRGAFITMEGGDAVGKTTQMQLVAEFLQSQGLRVVVTREPGGTVFGEHLREALLADRQIQVCAEAELLTVFAARAQHLEECVIPALKSGAWVLCDRFTDATFAYQGGGRELGFARVERLRNFVQGDFNPDCTLLLDVDEHCAEQRRAGRQQGNSDRFEEENRAFRERVRASYLRLASMHPQRIAVIDASVDVAAVSQAITAHLTSVVKEFAADTIPWPPHGNALTSATHDS